MALPVSPLPVIKKGWQKVLFFFLVYLAGVLLTGTVLGWIAAKKSGFSALRKLLLDIFQNDTIIIPGLFMVAAISVLLVIFFRKKVDHATVSSLGLSYENHFTDVFTGIAAGVAMLGAGTLILYFNHNLRWSDIIFNGRDFFTGLVLMIAVAIAEELVFRGYILHHLLESFNSWVALAITSVAFATMHAANPHISFIAYINLVMAGLLLGINYVYTRSLWFAIGFHFTWNFFQGPVLGFYVSGLNLQSILQPELTGNTIITGGEFGFEGSMLCGVLTIILLLLSYWFYETRYGKAGAAGR